MLRKTYLCEELICPLWILTKVASLPGVMLLLHQVVARPAHNCHNWTIWQETEICSKSEKEEKWQK